MKMKDPGNVRTDQRQTTFELVDTRRDQAKGLKVFSLFSGAMGLDLGFEAAGAEIVGCVESDVSAAQTARRNRPKIPVISRDIGGLSVHEALCLTGCEHVEIDVLTGGPPCQAFSTMGRRRGTGDARGRLVFDFCRFVEGMRPRLFVMENVRGLLSMTGDVDPTKGGLMRELVARFSEAGYAVDIFVVNAVNYGCAQTRERVFVIGNRLGLQVRFPSPTHGDGKNLKPFSTLKNAIGGMREVFPEVMDFSPRKKRFLAMVPPGGNWRCLPESVQRESMGASFDLKGGRSAFWRRLSWDAPSPTLVTMPNHRSTSLCHPDETRALSVGEYAAIQGFPVGWEFTGTTAEKYKQIGNAVPVELGKMAALAVASSIEKREPRKHDIEYTETHIRPHVRVNTYKKRMEMAEAA